MNLDEWNLEYQRLTQRFMVDMRKLTKQLPDALRHAAQEMASDEVVASTNTPDIPGQARLNLTPGLNEVA